jgi:hypothetical protein
VLVLGDSATAQYPYRNVSSPSRLAYGAGNLAILILPPRTLTTSKLLPGVLSNALDGEVIGILSPTKESQRYNFLLYFATRKFHAVCVESFDALHEVHKFSFLQMSPTMRENHLSLTVSAPIVVTRNTDLQKAVNDIAEANFVCCYGRST